MRIDEVVARDDRERFGVKGLEGPADRTPPGILSQAAFNNTGEAVPG